LELIVSPIAGANPCGENINYDASFDALKSEISKVGNIDYDLVETNAKTILKDKSKDLRVFAFLSYAYLRNDDWESLADIFEGLLKLSDKFDALFPERPTARVNALKWLAEPRYTETLAEKKPGEGDYDHLKRLLESLDKLKPIVDKAFPEGSPFPAQLHKSAQNWEKTCKPKPKEAVSVGPAAGANAVPLDTPKDAQAATRKAAQILIDQEPTKPLGYRLLRSVRWDIIEKALPATEGKTQLQAPVEQARTAFLGMVAQKDWKTILPKTETMFASGVNHVWLDLQRISAGAAKELSEPYKAVRDAILFETAIFIKRVPEMLTLAYADGFPFCDQATKDWIAKEVNPVLSAGGASISVSSIGGDDEDPLVVERRKVDALVSANQLEQAIELLQEGMSRSTSERDNFIRSMQMGNLLVKMKQADIAVSLLESLNEKVEEYHLDKWDPALTMDAWATLFSAYKVAKAGKPPAILQSLTDKQNVILSRISRINPKKAFLLNK
jgi:type VI secretion system protein VasJ